MEVCSHCRLFDGDIEMDITKGGFVCHKCGYKKRLNPHSIEPLQDETPLSKKRWKLLRILKAL